MRKQLSFGLMMIMIYTIPYLCFFIQDHQVSQQIIIDTQIRPIYTEVSSIPLIRNLHMQDNYHKISPMFQSEINQVCNEELQKLVEANIISQKTADMMMKQFLIGEPSQLQQESMISYYFMQNDEIQGMLDIDAETKKIIRILVPTNEELEEPQTLLYYFIQYLELDIINDWKYRDEAWISEKANCIVRFSITEPSAQRQSMLLEITPHFEITKYDPPNDD